MMSRECRIIGFIIIYTLVIAGIVIGIWFPLRLLFKGVGINFFNLSFVIAIYGGIFIGWFAGTYEILCEEQMIPDFLHCMNNTSTKTPTEEVSSPISSPLITDVPYDVLDL